MIKLKKFSSTKSTWDALENCINEKCSGPIKELIAAGESQDKIKDTINYLIDHIMEGDSEKTFAHPGSPELVAHRFGGGKYPKSVVKEHNWSGWDYKWFMVFTSKDEEGNDDGKYKYLVISNYANPMMTPVDKDVYNKFRSAWSSVADELIADSYGEEKRYEGMVKHYKDEGYVIITVPDKYSIDSKELRDYILDNTAKSMFEGLYPKGRP